MYKDNNLMLGAISVDVSDEVRPLQKLHTMLS